ncbi:MAG: hypothetical protein U0570_04950 [Phycisphaerales bacterium]
MSTRPKSVRAIKWVGVVLSLFLFAVWIVSTRVVGLCALQSGWFFGFAGGQVGFGKENPSNRFLPPGVGFERHALGFNWESRFRVRDTGEIEVYTPAPFVLAPVAIVTLVAWRVDAIARRRARVGHCSKCGYDLSATPEGAKCPECGAGRPAATLG